MSDLIHELISARAETHGEQPALLFRDDIVSYSRLLDSVHQVSNGLLAAGLASGDRVAVFLPKQVETVAALFGAACAGACFVPINSLLKPRQVTYILEHSQARVLVTSLQRLQLLEEELDRWQSVETVIVVDDRVTKTAAGLVKRSPVTTIIPWPELRAAPSRPPYRRIDNDVAAILYTSGSTGHPKGVVLSHRNLVAGARSVAQYLDNTPDDRILALLPLSFDAGLSQLTTAFCAGASAVLMDYLLPRDVMRAVVRYEITGLGAIPTVWNQLVQLPWPAQAADTLRYITNTGGTLPVVTTQTLSQRLPNTRIFLMYGLTEAFRSTYLPPEQVALRPKSIGKAIPNAEILVVNESGQPCGPNEPGELVHRGALVALGYWQDVEKTAERFRPIPGQNANLPMPEIAVWSGDQVVRDEEGYLYFVSRKDDMIKTSGYRVSPTEIEEVAYNSGLVADAVAMGIPHEQLGQTILLIVTPAVSTVPNTATETTGQETLHKKLVDFCKRELPHFMQPADIVVRETMPHTQHGKINCRALAMAYLPPQHGTFD